MENKTTVTIGIPAFNEAANIKRLILSLLVQKEKGFVLKEIIIVSDGSTDATTKVVRSFQHPMIRLVERESRQGLALTQNEIVSQARGNILILLDADVLPVGKNFLVELIQPILKDKQVGIVGAATTAVKPNNFIESVLANSHELKKLIYQNINRGSNLYLCHGRARAFSETIYRKITWPNHCPEDSYSYLFCISRGYKFIYNQKAKVVFRCPSSLSEYFSKSTRFFNGKINLEKYFKSSFIKEHYKIPVTVFIITVGLFLVTRPIVTISYLIIVVGARLLFKPKADVNYSMWSISKTSKNVVGQL